MPTTNRRKTDLASDAPAFSLSMNELTAVLVKHYGLTEGKYELGIEFQIGVGPVGPPNQQLLPGVVLGVKSVGLSPSAVDTATTVDAATLKEELTAPKRAKTKKAEKAL